MLVVSGIMSKEDAKERLLSPLDISDSGWQLCTRVGRGSERSQDCGKLKDNEL